ncbi:hypothetical protein Q3G72_027009 [Acer saccharum]|nr:hypothetical protein Q3G72_027009 [Acer saccharum]
MCPFSFTHSNTENLFSFYFSKTLVITASTHPYAVDTASDHHPLTPTHTDDWHPLSSPPQPMTSFLFHHFPPFSFLFHHFPAIQTDITLINHDPSTPTPKSQNPRNHLAQNDTKTLSLKEASAEGKLAPPSKQNVSSVCVCGPSFPWNSRGK